VKEMFYHAFDNYMRHAFPLDELRPMSCTGEDTLGSYSLTLIDALDMLALLGDRARFSEAVNWLGKNLQFGKVHYSPWGTFCMLHGWRLFAWGIKGYSNCLV
jgi:mannosidase alpha-like ER degradation enhancer 2